MSGAGVLDIGAHFVSWSLTSGLAMDSDGDGIPDYLEDANGNGTYDFADGMTDVDTPGMKPDNTPYALQFKAGM